jgi:hypothetical protein
MTIISRWHRSAFWLGAAAVVAPLSLFAASELGTPFRVEVGGKPLDVDRPGHAAPFVADFDGDGIPDLLVGQFNEGKLRIFRNQGKSGEHKFTTSVFFKAGGADARVPAG